MIALPVPKSLVPLAIQKYHSLICAEGQANPKPLQNPYPYQQKNKTGTKVRADTKIINSAAEL